MINKQTRLFLLLSFVNFIVAMVSILKFSSKPAVMVCMSIQFIYISAYILGELYLQIEKQVEMKELQELNR